MVQSDVVPTVTRQSWTLPEGKVDELKKQLIDEGLPPILYKLTLFNQDYVFRPLFNLDKKILDDYEKQNQSTLTVDDIYEKTCQLGLLWPLEVLNPVQWQVQRAGLQETLAKNIRARSGYSVPGIDQSDYLKLSVLSEPEPGREPTEEEVEELKKKYNWGLIKAKIGNDWYIYRPISRAEWKALAKEGLEEINLRCCERAVVWTKAYPKKFNFDEAPGLAGLVDTLSTLIMEASGFDTPSVVEEL